MTPTTGERSRQRRFGALLVLVIGIAVAVTVFGESAPQDQALVFRLPMRPGASATVLEAHFTPVGEREPIRGLTLTVSFPQPREVRQPVRLPDGDYIVAVQLTWEPVSGPSAPVKMETISARRVTLNGHETLVVLDAKGSD